jgi:hypothetical protein
MNKKTIEQLEKELADLKAYHKSAWDTYGSELCAGDMIRQEEELKKEILRLKILEKLRERGLVDENDKPIPAKPMKLEPSDPPIMKTETIEPINIGFKQLLDRRKETISQWEKSGLLEGLSDDIKENICILFEGEKQQKIDE